MASPCKALQRCLKCVLANNSETVGYKDLIFGKIVYILVFHNISFSWLLPLDGFQFIFRYRVYRVTVKTKNKKNPLNGRREVHYTYSRNLTVFEEAICNKFGQINLKR